MGFGVTTIFYLVIGAGVAAAVFLAEEVARPPGGGSAPRRRSSSGRCSCRSCWQGPGRNRHLRVRTTTSPAMS